MLPQDALSSPAWPASFLPPRNRAKRPWHDWEQGGVALNDASQGLELKTWHLEYSDGDFILSAPGVVPAVVFSTADPVREVALAFDQNMQPVVAWITDDGVASYRWFDPTLPGFDIVELPAGSTSPRLALDDHREIATTGGTSDVILAYVRDGELFYRQQRDRFLDEYSLASGLGGAALDRIGLNVLLRFQFRVLGGVSDIEQPMANGGFEAGDLSGWTIVSEDVSVFVDGDYVLEGDFSARCLFDTSAQISFEATDRLPTAPGQTQQCRVAIGVLQSFGETYVQPYMRWYDAGESFISETALPWRYISELNFNFVPPFEWLVHVWSSVAPAGAAFWAPRFQVATAIGGWFAVDAVRASTVASGTTGDSAGTTVARIIERTCARAGVLDVDTTDLREDSIWGYTVSRESSARTVLEQLRAVGRYDIVERGPTIRFPKRGGAVVATIPAAALGAHLAGSSPPPAMRVTDAQDVELPRQIRLSYNAIARDYQPGESLSQARQETRSTNDISMETPVAMTEQRATETAEVIHRETWAGKSTFTFSLGPEYIRLEPADPIIVPAEGRERRVRITRIRDEALILRHFEALRDDDGAYVSIAIDAGTGVPPELVHLLAQTDMSFLDLPSLVLGQHDEGGFYLRVERIGAGTSWTGATIYTSADGITYTQHLTIAAEAITGIVVTPPAAGGDGYTWDNEREIVVDVDRGTLAGTTDAAVLAGANRAAIGAPGRWQIVQWVGAELVQPGRYRLTRLLHGRRGTEHLIDTMLPGDEFVLLHGIARMPVAAGDIDVERFYRAVTNGAAYADGVVTSFASAGQALAPLSPVRVRGTRDGSGNLTVTWMRRDRLSEALRDGVAVPLSEDSEAYDVDVLDGEDVVRTFAGLVTPTVEYTGTDQTTDFGGLQDPVTLEIVQLSAQVGRGTPARVTL